MTSKESGALASDHGTTEIKSKKPPVPLPILPVQATKPGISHVPDCEFCINNS